LDIEGSETGIASVIFMVAFGIVIA